MKIKKHTIILWIVVMLIIIALAYYIGLPKKEEPIEPPIEYEEIPFGVEDASLSQEEINLLNDIVNGRDTLTPSEWTGIAGSLLEKMVVRVGIDTAIFINEYRGQNYNEIIRALELRGR